MSDTREPTAVRAGGGWKRWLLVASLAFNVLVIGAMAGRAFINRHGPIANLAGSGGTLTAFTQQLPMERRREIWATLKDDRVELRALRTKAREARADVRAALTAEPYDAARFKAAQDRLLDAEITVRRASQQVFERIAQGLSKEERVLFARHLAAEGQKGGHRGWRRGGGGREQEPLDEPAPTPPKN
jgi:uncharacterized membrane protein